MHFSNWRVLLDPGHGMKPDKRGGLIYDQGAAGPAITEHELAWYLAARVQLGLELCRFGQVDIAGAPYSLHQRGSLATYYDIFVSLHFNAFDRHVQGSEVFITPESSLESALLADCIQDSFMMYMGDVLKDRGVKRSGLKVLRSVPAHVPACLVEPFFLDALGSRTEVFDLAVKSAAAIVDGITNFCGRDLNHG